MEDLPNWIKPLPGLLVLGIATVAYFGGYIWPWGWGVGVVLLCVGILILKKDDGYHQ